MALKKTAAPNRPATRRTFPQPRPSTGAHRRAATTARPMRSLKQRTARGKQAGRVGTRRWYHVGLREGAAWRAANPRGTAGELREHIHARWPSVYGRMATLRQWPTLRRQGISFAEGMREGAGLSVTVLPVPLRGRATAVLNAGSDPARLESVLTELMMLPLDEIVIVLHDASDRMLSVAMRHDKAVILHMPFVSLSPGEARAAGARLTGEDIVLFIDGEKPVSAESLAPFLIACDCGTDVALNDTAAHDDLFHRRGESAWLREFLNVSLGRPDLRTNSLEALPYALSRSAIDAIGFHALGHSAKAYVTAVMQGKKIGIGGRVPGHASPGIQAIPGYMEAWREATSLRGSRLQFRDTVRNRSVVGGEWHDAGVDHHTDV